MFTRITFAACLIAGLNAAYAEDGNPVLRGCLFSNSEQVGDDYIAPDYGIYTRSNFVAA